MNESFKIPKLELLLASSLENGEVIIGTNISSLTAPGENYGSIMLRVDISIRNEDTGKERTLNAVCKLIPESERIQEVFNTQLTYRNEYKFYDEIVPVLDRLLKSKGISSGADFTAPYLGGRTNLDGTDVVTSDAVILLENLKTAGYTMVQKSKGFDFETSKLILNSLAKLHAAGIALKRQEPHTFEKISSYFYCFAPEGYFYDMILNKVIDKLDNNGFSREKIDVVAGYKNASLQKTKYINETWGTIIHYDSWTNNFLIKYEDNKPTHIVLVDFQVFDYKSPLDDVMFFLFISVQEDIFEEKIDPLLEYYYRQLLHYLKILEVDTQPFTKHSFEAEVKLAVENYEYVHALWMLYVVMQKTFVSIDELPLQISADWSEKHVQRIVRLTNICFKRGWLSVK